MADYADKVKNVITSSLLMMRELYPSSRPISDVTIGAWMATDLRLFDPESVSRAFACWINAGDSRMPTPVEILKILRGSEEDLALAALIKVEKAMSRHGSYATVVFDDPIIHAVIDELGGWIKCCHVTEKELTWWEKDFRERYRHHLRRGIPLDVSPKLLGILDETNLPHGETPQKPVVIGDYEKAIGWVSKLENPDSLALDKKNAPESITESTKDGI